MHLRSIKKLGAEVYLNEPIGKDKDDNEIALIDILIKWWKKHRRWNRFKN